jgi:cytochrome P450
VRQWAIYRHYDEHGGEVGPTLRHFCNVMQFRDPPDSTRLRGLVSKAFTIKRTEVLREDAEEISRRRLTSLRPRAGWTWSRPSPGSSPST